MKLFLVLAVLSLIPGVGFTQGAALESEVDSELEQIYTSSPARSVAVRRAEAAQNNSAQPIYILNQATPSANANSNSNSNSNVQAQLQTQQIQKQPTTFVEASPLVESRADQMRKSRVDAESQTETKIVEKLEQSRLDDEKRRADLLFGNKFDQMNRKDEVVPVAPVVVAPVAVQPAPAVVEVVPKDALTREDIREEIKSAMKVEEAVAVAPLQVRYFSGVVGFPDIPESTNVRGQYSLGATYGLKYDEGIAVEGTFLYSNLIMNPIYRDGAMAPDMNINQYSGYVGMKYSFFSGMLKPYLGGGVQYSYRTYNWSPSPYMGATPYSQNMNDSSATSHAIDLGTSIGLNIVFTPKFTVGLEYRYMFNLGSVKNESSYVYQPFYGAPLEDLSSTLVIVNTSFQF